MNAYLLMAAVYLLAALLAALDSALTSFGLAPWFAGLPWLRVHLITLGAITQAVFGLLPALAARQNGQSRPPARLELWLLLNAGLILLIAGVPAVNGALILGGGTLVFLATALLLWQLHMLRAGAPVQNAPRPRGGLVFYLAGLGFLLVGILAGTGLWLGWGGPLQMARPKEVHLHANIWGFTALVFAGLLVDIFPRVTGRAVAWPRTIPAIFWLMSGGSLLLLIAPWAGLNQLTAPGMLLMLAATLWLLLNLIVPLRGARRIWSQPGIWHLLTAYYWVLTPLFALPVVLAMGGRANVPQARIEQDAPQWLVYGWLLHFAYALLPYFYRRAAQPGQPAGLGGSWFSLAAVHLGSLFFWAGILAGEAQAVLQGAGYLCWSASMAPILFSLWQQMRRGGELARSGGFESG
jgi:cytochrome c oxidase cbb3-type subunit I